ncbi:MAG: DbpA RNA binding domain-containing protein, partial [Candidatus Marinamargulisbacteria bacterium]
LILFSIIPQDPDSYIQRIIRLETALGVTAVATLITNNEIKKMAFIKRATKSKITSKPFMEPHHIIQKKQEDMRGLLAKDDSFNGDESITLFSKQLLTEYSAEKVVLFLLNHGFQGAFSLDAYPALTPKPSSSKNKSKDTGSHDVPGFERLFIAIGKTDDITESALKDFLYSETSIEQHHYSEIKIFETFSFFLVSEENAEVILEIFRRKKRGKRSIVERAKGKDAKKKN